MKNCIFERQYIIGKLIQNSTLKTLIEKLIRLYIEKSILKRLYTGKIVLEKLNI